MCPHSYREMRRPWRFFIPQRCVTPSRRERPSKQITGLFTHLEFTPPVTSNCRLHFFFPFSFPPCPGL